MELITVCGTLPKRYTVFYFAKCTDVKIQDQFVYSRVCLIENAVGTKHILKASGFAVQYLILLAPSLSELTQPSTRLAGLLLKTQLAKRCPALKSGNAPLNHQEKKAVHRQFHNFLVQK